MRYQSDDALSNNSGPNYFDTAVRFNASVIYFLRYSYIFHMTIFTIKNRFKMNFVEELKYKFEEKRRCVVIYTVNHVDSIWTERFNSASILELTEECLQTTTIEHPYSVFSTTNHKSLVYKTPTTVPCSSRFKVTSISNSEYINQPDSIQYGYLIKL